MEKTVLFIGLVWPEPEATAAGVRILQLIELFQHYECNIVFSSAAKKSDLSYDLSINNVEETEIELNNHSFDSFIQALNPDFVVFDRFLTEEQFGWRVEENCPKAIKILDTEDLHFLRKSRKSDEKINFIDDDLAKREIASIYRSDLSLIISEFEMNLLKEEFHIPEDLLQYLPFLENSISETDISEYPSFSERKDFISMGNFKHEPNWKAVLKLKTDIWPRIRKLLPTAEIHIYGAYATQKIFDLNNSSEGFVIKGWAENVPKVYTASRVCLAPLDFGAGIKGKLLHSMKFGTPNITTSVGAEGMKLNQMWNGYISNSSEEFASKAVELYKSSETWSKFQKIGVELFNNRFNKDKFYNIFWRKLTNIDENKDFYRSNNFIGAMLRHHQHRSTKFLSKYIELKNKD